MPPPSDARASSPASCALRWCPPRLPLSSSAPALRGLRSNRCVLAWTVTKVGVTAHRIDEPRHLSVIVFDRGQARRRCRRKAAPWCVISGSRLLIRRRVHIVGFQPVPACAGRIASGYVIGNCTFPLSARLKSQRLGSSAWLSRFQDCRPWFHSLCAPHNLIHWLLYLLHPVAAGPDYYIASKSLHSR